MSSVIKVDQIQNSSGVNGISIDSNGEVSVNNHFIGVYKNGNQTISDGGFTQLTDWSVSTNNGLTWDATNHSIVVAKAGSYLINFQAQIYSDSNAAGDFRMQIYKNGSGLFGTYNMIVGNANTADPYDLRHSTGSIQNIVPLQAGDYIQAYVYLDVTAGPAAVFDGDSYGGERSCSINMLRLGD